MTKRSDEDSIHPSETAYDKAIKRMEEREARILNSPIMQVAASVVLYWTMDIEEFMSITRRAVNIILLRYNLIHCLTGS